MKTDKIDLTPEILFSRPLDEKFGFNEDLIELFAYGLSLSNDTTRPFMIFKDKSGELTLPVPINQLEAGITLTQSAHQTPAPSTHVFSERLLESLNIRIDKCLFVEIKGVHQYVRLYMTGHPQYQSLKFRADEVMSLCIQFKVPVFASKGFINRSKEMSAEIVSLAEDLAQNPMSLVKHHTYLM